MIAHSKLDPRSGELFSLLIQGHDCSSNASLLHPSLAVDDPPESKRLLPVSEKEQQIWIDDEDDEEGEEKEEENQKISANRSAERSARKKSERVAYLIAAMMSSFGITSMAIAAVYYRF